MPGVLNVLLAGGPQFIATGIDINDSDFAIAPATALALNQILADGSVHEGGVDVGDLLTLGDPGDVEIFVETVSGTVTTGTVDAWVAISGNPSWSLERLINGTSTYTATYRLRSATTGVVFFTGGNFSLTATRDV
jgi:hypothetical protein